MRRLAVRRVLAGETHATVAASCQVSRTTVSKWMMAYYRGGDEALASRKAPGPEGSLSKKQQEQLKRIILTKTPNQLTLDFALWTVPLVGKVIERRFGLILHPSTVWRIVRRLGLTPQVPARRAFKRSDEECRAWMLKEFPAIVRYARRRQAVLLFSDEAGIDEHAPIGRTWGERGKRPVVRVAGGRQRVNIISAISPSGRCWWRSYGGTLTALRYQGFLTDLLHDIRGEIVLVIDSHPAHVAKSTRTFLRAHRKRLKVFTLPAYAPDLNPDEHVWSYVKSLFRQEPVSMGEDLKDSVNDEMSELARDRKRVIGFFGHPEVAYVRKALGWE
jgi:transposase